MRQAVLQSEVDWLKAKRRELKQQMKEARVAAKKLQKRKAKLVNALDVTDAGR